MTLSLSDNRWLKGSLILLTIFAACALWAYLGGGIFLLAHQRKFEDATPLTLYQYWFYYGTDSNVLRWLYISSALAFLVITAPSLFFLSPKKRSLYGTARFARTSEIRKAGLFGTRGLILGCYRKSYLMFGGSFHVLMSAPTRSGKGVGVVIPNLLTWPDSVVVLDIKQENHAITSAFRRKHGQPCYLFNPAATDYRSHRYNPLSYISEDPNIRVDDIQKIANLLFPDQPGTDTIWTATPRALFLGIVLYLLETPGKLVTFGQVLRETLADGDGSKYFANIISVRALGDRISKTNANEAARLAQLDVDTLLADRGKSPEHHPRMAEIATWIVISKHYKQAFVQRLEELSRDGKKVPDLLSIALAIPVDVATAQVGKALSGTCVRALYTYITISSDNTRAGVMTSFRARLELWNNPLVDAATSANDFDLREVRKKRMSIYLGVTPDNLKRMSWLLNLFFQQLIDINTRELPERNPALKYQCLLFPDEFTSMGKIEVLADGISYIAGYGLRMFPIIQSPAQLVDKYGEQGAQNLVSNHAAQIVFPPMSSELKTAKDISEWLGYQTVKGTSESKSKNFFSKREQSESTSDQRRALLLPQEITSLGANRQIVVVKDCPPILAERIVFHRDHVFMDRLKSVSTKLAAYGRKLPKTKAEFDAIVLTGELSAPVPKIDIAAHQALVGEHFPPHGPPVSANDGRAEVVVIERAVLPSEVPKLNKLFLYDFAVDFSKIERPSTDEIDIPALQAYADSLCREAGITI